MNASQLLKHFDRISNAPDAIQRLRGFILALAVRGKLVEQNLKDEPPAKLLELTNTNLPVAPDLPSSWIRAKIGNILVFQYGKSLPASERLDQGRVRVFGSNGVIAHCVVPLTVESAIIIGRKGSAGALNLCIGPSWTTDVAYFVESPPFFDIHFLFITLQSLELGIMGKGVKPGLSRNEAYELEIVIPPLAEQHRIVAKVDELMKLCDRLEAAQAIRENQRNRLEAASLQCLNQPADESKFQEHARFYFNHLPRLTTRPEHIQQLRQTILNLAMHGKLVRQDPSDDSPESILSEIHRIRATTINHSKNSEVDDTDPKFVQHIPKALPSTWRICPLEELFRFIDYRGRTPTRTTKGIRLITAKNVRMGYVSEEPIEFIAEEEYCKWMTRGFPQNSDILFVTEGATMGYVGMIKFLFVFALAQRTINFHPYLPNYSKFFLYAFLSPLFQDAVRTNSTGTAVKGIKAAKLKRIRVPLPPLAEQHRIVAKVDELMSVCDNLETQLTTTQTESSRLLEALLHEALAPAV